MAFRDDASLLNRMFPSAGRQSFLSSMSIEEFADTCQAITDGPVQYVRYRTVFCTVRGAEPPSPEPLPHFGSAPRFSLLAGRLERDMMTLKPIADRGTMSRRSCHGRHDRPIRVPSARISAGTRGLPANGKKSRGRHTDCQCLLDRQNEQDFDSSIVEKLISTSSRRHRHRTQRHGWHATGVRNT